MQGVRIIGSRKSYGGATQSRSASASVQCMQSAGELVAGQVLLGEMQV